MTSNFNKYSAYYDLFYQDKDYSAEGNYLIRTIRKYLPAAYSILELGSGTGKHAGILTNQGFIVHGIERSKDMVAISLQRALANFTCQQGDIRNFTIDRKFDAAFSLFHVVSYLTDNNQLIEMLQNANKHLQIGGIFIFDAWFTPAVLLQYPEKRQRQVSQDHIRITRKATPIIHLNTNVVDVTYDILVEDLLENTSESFSELHSMRHYGIPEIELAAQCAGFKLIGTEESVSGNPPGKDTWGVCFILQKS